MGIYLIEFTYLQNHIGCIKCHHITLHRVRYLLPNVSTHTIKDTMGYFICRDFRTRKITPPKLSTNQNEALMVSFCCVVVCFKGDLLFLLWIWLRLFVHGFFLCICFSVEILEISACVHNDRISNTFVVKLLTHIWQLFLLFFRLQTNRRELHSPGYTPALNVRICSSAFSFGFDCVVLSVFPVPCQPAMNKNKSLQNF